MFCVFFRGRTGQRLVGRDGRSAGLFSDPAGTWNRPETLVAFRLYCATPFGKLHQTNPDIVALAARLGRTPSAVGMKACNFASLDPRQRERGISALGNVSGQDVRVWEEYAVDPAAVAAEAEAAYEALTGAA